MSEESGGHQPVDGGVRMVVFIVLALPIVGLGILLAGASLLAKIMSAPQADLMTLIWCGLVASCMVMVGYVRYLWRNPLNEQEPQDPIPPEA